MSTVEQTPARVVLVTAPDLETARAIGRALVEERLAACANVVPGVTSVFRWEGQVTEQGEVLLVLKTVESRLEALERRVLRLHPYSVPECVALAAERVEPRYLAWLAAETDPAADEAGGGPAA